MLPSDRRTIQALRKLSGRVFGGADFRAEVGLAVADSERISKKDLEDDIRRRVKDPPSGSTIGNEVDLLVDLGLLSAENPHARSGKKFWQPARQSSYWSLCEELLTKAQATAKRR